MHNATRDTRHGRSEERNLPIVRWLTFESDAVAENLEKLVKERRVVIVVENLLLAVLSLLHVYDTHFQFRLDENLRRKREKEITRVQSESVGMVTTPISPSRTKIFSTECEAKIQLNSGKRK
jgi:hypothetical protein